MRSFAVIFVVASAVVLAACGGGETTTVVSTQIVTETITTEAEPVAASSVDERVEYCESEYGDALDQAQSAADDAFNDADVAAMIRAEKKALRAARKAPPGASCAVETLKSVRFNWNNGSGNFSSVDTVAKAKAVRRFQKENDLLKAEPDY